MNWEAVGAISQIVGAVLVGVTLIYLAVETPTEHICAEIVHVPGHQHFDGFHYGGLGYPLRSRAVAHKSPGRARRTFS